MKYLLKEVSHLIQNQAEKILEEKGGSK